MTTTLFQECKKGCVNAFSHLRTKASLLTFSLITAIAGFIFYNQATQGRFRSDLPAHLRFIREHFEMGRKLDHPLFHYTSYYLSQLFHVNLAATAAAVLTLCVLMSAVIIFLILQNSLRDDYPEKSILFFTFCLMIVTAIYVPFFNPNIYLGQSSPTVWHNPSTIVVKPFAFLSVILFAYLITIGDKRKLLVLSLVEAVIIAASVAAKPNFFLAFFPAVFVFFLLMPETGKKYFRGYLLISVPALAVLGWEYFVRFGDGGHSSIMIDIFAVWNHYTPNIFISLILLIAFPLSVLVFYPRDVLKNNYLVLSWLVFAVALLQYSIFAEAGQHHFHGNFGWGRQIILPMVFTYSVVVWMKSVKNPNRRPLDTYKNYCVWACFLLHAVSGIFYVGKIFVTGGFH
jgi:hypothetical protein